MSLTWMSLHHLMDKTMNTGKSSNESIKITQITTTQTNQFQKRETGPAQQTRHSCDTSTLSKNTQSA